MMRPLMKPGEAEQLLELAIARNARLATVLRLTMVVLHTVGVADGELAEHTGGWLGCAHPLCRRAAAAIEGKP